MPVSVTVKVYHCGNGDGLFDEQIGFGTHSVRQCKFDGDCDGDGDGGGTCKWTWYMSLQMYPAQLKVQVLTCGITMVVVVLPSAR